MPPMIQVGDVRVQALTWPAHACLTPQKDHSLLLERVGAILDEQLSLEFPATA